MVFDLPRVLGMVLAICVMLSLAFAPVFSFQAMASHHPVTSVEQADIKVADHADHGVARKDCGDRSSKSSKMDMDCCDMTCSSVVVLANYSNDEVPTDFSIIHALVDADQLTSRVNFGLKRPPRV
jgi:hypothetical protein